MTRRKLFAFTLAVLVVSLTGLAPWTFAQAPPETKPLQIGMAKTFFHDIPKPFIKLATGTFKDLMKATTELDGDLLSQYDAFEVAQQLNDNKMQLGVFAGHEFAWVQQRYPTLTPLMVAVNHHRDVRALVIVRKDSPFTKIEDLKEKILDMPLATKEHCRLFLAKRCTDNAHRDAKTFFAKVHKSGTAEEALDDVCRGKVQAAIVDTIWLEFYKAIKAPCYNKNLRILEESKPFPPVVLAYKQGAVSEAILTKFRDGLMRGHETDEGRDMMKMWKIAGFESVPNNYAQDLIQVLKEYPPALAQVSLR